MMMMRRNRHALTTPPRQIASTLFSTSVFNNQDDGVETLEGWQEKEESISHCYHHDDYHTTSREYGRRMKRKRTGLSRFVGWALPVLFLVAALAAMVSKLSRHHNNHYGNHRHHRDMAGSSIRTTMTAISSKENSPKQQKQLTSQAVKQTTLPKENTADNPSSTYICNCFSKNPACCDRKLLRAHKMGVVLLRDLILQPFADEITSEIIHPSVLEPHLLKQDSRISRNRTTNHLPPDYRHVVVTRPWYDSIVSGYLYHKSGRECWLDQEGQPRRKNKTFVWEPYLTIPHAHLAPPDGHRTTTTGISLCQYLINESEEDGMRAYVDLSLHQLYAGILPHRALVLSQEQSSQPNKTLFVCFEELSHPATQQATFDKIMKHLFPAETTMNHTNTKHTFPPQRQNAWQKPMAVAAAATTTAAAAAANQAFVTVSESISSGSNGASHVTAAGGAASYGGGHATSKDPELRQRLLRLVEHYDRELFHSQAANATQLFGC